MSVAPVLPSEPKQIEPPVLSVSPQLEKDPLELLRRDKKIAKALKQFLRENPSQKISIDGKKYPKREAWQFVAMCKGYTAMITSTESILDDKGQEFGFIATAHTLDSQGRVISGGEGACKYEEKDWTGKPSFQLVSMAQTRACNKTLQNVLAYIMVMAKLCPTPAEEMPEPESKSKSEFKTQCEKASCPNMISERRRQETRRKYGKALCVPCENSHKEAQAEKILNPINDPKFVERSIEQVRQKKANGAQPVVELLDRASFSI